MSDLTESVDGLWLPTALIIRLGFFANEAVAQRDTKAAKDAFSPLSHKWLETSYFPFFQPVWFLMVSHHARWNFFCQWDTQKRVKLTGLLLCPAQSASLRCTRLRRSMAQPFGLVPHPTVPLVLCSLAPRPPSRLVHSPVPPVSSAPALPLLS